MRTSVQDAMAMRWEWHVGREMFCLAIYPSKRADGVDVTAQQPSRTSSLLNGVRYGEEVPYASYRRSIKLSFPQLLHSSTALLRLRL